MMLITLHIIIQIQSHSSLKIIQIITITMSVQQLQHTVVGTLHRVNEIIKCLRLRVNFVTVEATIIQPHQRVRAVQNHHRPIHQPRNGNQVSYCVPIVLYHHTCSLSLTSHTYFFSFSLA